MSDQWDFVHEGDYKSYNHINREKEWSLSPINFREEIDAIKKELQEIRKLLENGTKTI